MDSKAFWTSKTLWFNFAIAILVFVDQNLGFLQAHLSAWGYTTIVGILAGGNALLRLITSQPVAFGNTQPEVKK